MKKISILFVVIAIFAAVTFSCKKNVKVTGVQLDKTTLTLDIGATAKLTATILPADATDKTVRWTSNDETKAIVNDGIVTAKATGTATITVTTNDGNIKASCMVIITGTHFVEPDMVLVEGDTFLMGCISNFCNDNELPNHSVTVSDFKIGKYLITQKQWVAIMENNRSTFKGDDLPVENVSWEDIQEFITKLNAATGKNYRLATEAEWEYAARGGKNKNKYIYSGSNNIDEVAWYFGNSDNKTHPVGTKMPNALGIYDMSGNVWEWCNDWYGEYPSTLQNNPTGPAEGFDRVNRGGGWLFGKEDCQVSTRIYNHPSYRDAYLGFRLVLPL